MVIRGRALTAIKKERRRHKLKRAGLAVGLCLLDLLIYAGVSALALRLPVLRVETALVRGVSGAREAEVVRAANELLKERVWYIFPRYTMLSSVGSLSRSLERAVPWIEEARAALESPRTAEIRVTERQPAYLVCEAAEAETCYYADRKTLIFAPAPDFSAPVYPELRSPRLASSTLLRTQVFPDEVAAKWQELSHRLDSQGVTVGIIEETGEGSFRIYAIEGWYLFVTKEESLDDILASLNATTKSPIFLKELSARPKSLDYIDVRLGDKVFYKFRNGISNGTTTSVH